VDFRATVKQKLPRPVAELLRRMYWTLRTRADFRADRKRYRRYAMVAESSYGKLNGVHHEAQVTRDYHRVEKGLALPDPRRPFGQELLGRLDDLVPGDGLRERETRPYLVAASTARAALLEWNAGGEPSDEVAPIRPTASRLDSIDALFATRHSVRNYDGRPVEDTLLDRATELAAMSPSVCNRAPWHVRYYHGAEAHRVLGYQFGNGGFRETVPAIAVVSVELGLFAGSGERNQAWIEGGIFATSLLWALHGLGLDTCMLNLSLTGPQARDFRRATNMRESELPIVVIAIGYGTPGHRVARSPRRPTSDIRLN